MVGKKNYNTVINTERRMYSSDIAGVFIQQLRNSSSNDDKQDTNSQVFTICCWRSAPEMWKLCTQGVIEISAL